MRPPRRASRSPWSPSRTGWPGGAPRRRRAPQDAAWLDIVSAVRSRRGLAALPLFVGGARTGPGSPLAPPTGSTRPASSRSPIRCTRRAGPSAAGWTSSRRPAVPSSSCRAIAIRSACHRPATGRVVEVIAGADHALRKDSARIADLVVSFVTSTRRVKCLRMTEFRAARDFLQTTAPTTPRLSRGFDWPRPEHFNFATRLVRRRARGRAAEPARAAADRGGRHRRVLHLRPAVGTLRPGRRLAARPKASLAVCGCSCCSATRSNCGRRRWLR